MQKVDSRINFLKSRENPVLKREDVQEYLTSLQKNFVLVPIDKASNNIAIICQSYSGKNWDLRCREPYIPALRKSTG